MAKRVIAGETWLSAISERGSNKMKCQTPHCENTNIIYSGVDAFMREMPFTERFCYPCGNAYITIKNAVEEAKEKSNA